MMPTAPTNSPLTRKQFRRIMNAVARANAPGKEDRIAAAQAKRDRKNDKRALTAFGMTEDDRIAEEDEIWRAALELDMELEAEELEHE